MSQVRSGRFALREQACESSRSSSSSSGHRRWLRAATRMILLDLKSEKGLFYASFTPDPDPPTTGENALEISLADPNRQPVAQASIEIEPWMPGHGHGTPIVPVVTDLGAGK